jgi:hypothetical protein
VNEYIIQNIGGNTFLICIIRDGNIEVIGKVENCKDPKLIGEYIQSALREYKLELILGKS